MIKQTAEGYRLNLVGLTVGWITIRAQLCLELTDSNQRIGDIRINGRFHYGPPDSQVELVADGDDRSPLGAVLNLFHATITGARCQTDGTLLVDFNSSNEHAVVRGPQILVPPDPEYEAWEIDYHASKVVCCPGGELAIWS